MIERLTTITREVEADIDGETFSAAEKVGHVVRACPGKLLVDGQWVPNIEQVGEFIRLHLLGKTYRWTDPLDDYDADTSDHDPDTGNWEVE